MNILFVSAGTIIKDCGYKICLTSKVEIVNKLNNGNTFLHSFDTKWGSTASKEIIEEYEKSGVHVTLSKNKVSVNYKFSKIFTLILDNLKILGKVIKNDIEIISAAGHVAMIRCILMKIILRKPLIFDFRGVHIEERFSKSEGIVFNLLKKVEQLLMKYSDGYIFVSNVMRDYFAKGIVENKYIVIPNCINLKSFCFSSDHREKIRNENGLNDKIVVVYSGEIFEKWHMGEKLLQVFCEIKSKIPNSFFMILTSDNRDEVENLCNKYNLNKNDYFIKNVKHNEIHQFLSAADVSLLLREDSIINRVSSPTKAAEYLACGLPIIISKNVGDFSKIIEEEGVGYIFEEEEDNIEKISYWIKSGNFNKKSQCIETAKKYFDWQLYDHKLYDFYNYISK